MKRYLFTMLLIDFLCTINTCANNIIQQIKQEYQMLDSAKYIDKANKETCVCLFGKNVEALSSCYESKKKACENGKAIFLLNVDVDSAQLYTDNYVRVDTNELKFSILFLNKRNTVQEKLGFSNNKLYPFELDIKCLKKIIRKKPTYLLVCLRLPWTLLYVLDDKIFVCQTLTEKTYELKEYLQKIVTQPPLSNFRDYWQPQ